MSNLYDEARDEALQNIIIILRRQRANDGVLTPNDAVNLQADARVMETTTNGGPYGVTTYINGANREAIHAAAARFVGAEEAV